MLIKNFAFSGIFAAIVLSAGASFAVDTVASTTFVQKGDLAVYNALDNQKADKEAVTDLSNTVTDLSNDVGALTTALAQKQATLTAGANITIDGNTISATVPDVSNLATKAEVDAATENMVDTTALNTTLADYAKTAELPTVPTKVSDLTNDSGYITSNDIAGKADASTVTALSETVAGKADANNVYDKATVDQKLAEAAAGGTVDMSGYVKTADIDVVDEYDQTFE